MTLTRRALFAAAFVWLASQALHAQETIPLAGIAHVALRVKDLAASRAFYLSLGYQAPFALGGETAVFKINDHQFLELFAVSPQDPQPRFLHLCFEAEDLTALHEDYAANGLNPTAIVKAPTGNLLFTLPGPRQPLGPKAAPVAQTVEYIQYQPGSPQLAGSGQHLSPDRVADRLLGVSLAFLDTDAAREFYANDLNFKPLPNQQNLLHLPGNSGQYVSIQPVGTQGVRARIILETQFLNRAERDLRKNRINFVKIGTETNGNTAAIVFVDPDGNDILLEQR